MIETTDRTWRGSGPSRAATAFSCLLAALTFATSGPPSARAESSGSGAGSGAVGIAQREATRRQEQIRNAQELLTAAELERREGNYGDAVDKYRTAYLSLPDVPAAITLKESIFKRYQQSSVEHAEELIAAAEWEEAEAVLARVMTDARDAGMSPASVNTEVRTLLGRLRSDYFNKAMSPAHLANVSKVEELLKLAKGYVDIGDLTKAKRTYEAVLNIDRTNSAARRGLEMVDQLIMEYAEVARNQTRAQMLREVAEEWETPVPPTVDPVGMEITVEPVGVREAEVRAKLDNLVLPNVEFVNTPLQAVLEYLTQVAQELDTEPDPTKRGVNIVLDPQSTTQGPSILQKPVTLQLSRAPLGAVLQYVTQQVGMKYRIDEFAVTIVPLSSSDDQVLITRTYNVPPDFISGQGAQGGGGGGAPLDPFAQPAAADPGAGSVVKRVSAQEFLQNNGVTFPPGSLAKFNPANSSLIVRNTADNIELIESMIQGAKSGGSKLVQIDFKLIETTDRVLNELGFDWLLGQFNAPGSQSVFGGGGTFGNRTGSRGPGDYPLQTPQGIPIGGNPLTAGLRSGNIKTNLSIDDVISRDSPTATGSSAAPGILSVAGAFTDPQFQVVLRSLAQHKGVDFLCTASVVTRPGERAVVKQVREFIYPTEYDPPEIPNQVGGSTLTLSIGGQSASTSSGSVAVTPATPAAFETRELGKVLEVEPVVGADNLSVDLNLIADISEFGGFINYGSAITANDNLFQGFGFDTNGILRAFYQPLIYEITENRILMPVFDSVKENTQVTIYDGRTLVVGGLIGETVTKSEDKVPVLGDAPLMGRLFRSEVEDRFRRAMVLFATVRILDPGGKPLNDLGTSTSTASAP